MNSGDTTPDSPSTGRRIRIRPVKRASTSREAFSASLPSDDDNNDWVSPFTSAALPPLPAFKKQRSQVDRSPEDRLHNRSGSSAYYAAAWGSPYATPSPNQSPAVRVTRNKSFDIGSSPLSTRRSIVDPSSAQHNRQQSLPVQEPSRSKNRSASQSPVDKEQKSQRRNWLSESEDSAGESGRLGVTPTQRRFVSAQSHHIQESVDTITPETFVGHSSSDVTMEAHENQESLATEEKPLPSLPTDNSPALEHVQAQSRPPPLLPMQSFQRPKKKVPWKGKSCIIAMPLTDREQAGLPPVLTAQEKRDLLQKWIDLGYPVRGFSLGDWYSTLQGNGGASRATFPDPIEMESERRSGIHKVHIPDQGEWEAWKNYLMEEKLRALGVTPSTTEAPASTMSPFSSTMSRVSSAYPSMAPSPPVPPMSATAMRPQMSHSPFSPSISVPPGMPFPGMPQRTTSGLGNGRSGHGYTQSVAFPGMQHRNGSPFGFPQSQQGGYFGDVRSPALQNSSRRPWSPGHMQNMSMAPLNSMISPVNPSPQDFSRGFSSNPHIQAIQRQQEVLLKQQQEVQARIAHHRQMSLMPMHTISSDQLNQLPLTPKALSPDREPPEIMQPTPRSHRHNLSAALEKGVTESVAASTKNLAEALAGANDGNKKSVGIEEEKEEGEVEEKEEAEQEELPILHRPETLKDIDESAEIETNPSNAGTPLLLQDKDPFANFQPLPPPSSTQAKPRVNGHSAQLSLSKLNVQAKEFSPAKAAFSPSTNAFSFDGNALESAASSPGKSTASAPRFGHRHNPSSLGLNVTAATFVPSLPLKPVHAEDMLSKTHMVTEQPVEVTATPVKPVFEPRSSAFSFKAGNNSEYSTPAKSTFDPKSSVQSTFSFDSASFNVEAPEFKPSGINLADIAFTPEKSNQFSSEMFGDLTINSSAKSERRSKAVAIVKPSSRDNSADPEIPENVDEDGRPAAASDRFKRSKRVVDENEEILFADSAPFKTLANEHNPVQNVNFAKEDASDNDDAAQQASAEMIDEEGVTPPSQEVAQETLSVHESEPEASHTGTDSETATSQNDDNESGLLTPEAPALATTEALEEEETPSSPMPMPQRKSEEPDMATTTKTQSSIVPASTISPSHADAAESSSTGDKDIQSVEIDIAQALKPADSTPKLSADAPVFEPPVSKPASAFRPIAPAFEFRPAAQSFAPGLTATTTRKASPKPKAVGLMASKYASSPPNSATQQQVPASSDTEQPEMVGRNSSPPQQLYGNPEVEAPSKENYANEHPGHVSSPVSPMPESRHGNHGMSQDIIDTLEKFKEPEARSGSDVSKEEGDMSLDEINAVMKQFEEDPDLGIIREDTPVKSTPLLSARFPHQFRSDAPSPSPNRRLDGPFDPNTERPYGGLGFNMSDVHQLNYGGSGDISDWNADLSPGQQDKLEARAHFFDDHVNDILDNIIENRLAPLERALQSIEDHVQQGPGKARRSRRSMSTEQKDSDADDEDDYDAYEGYHHYRSRTPNKRDRRQERIKAAVLEAMTVAQSSTATQALDMTSIQSALDEMRSLAQQAREPADVSEIHKAIAQLRSDLPQPVSGPENNVEELARDIIEMKTLLAQRAAEPQLDMQAILAEIKQTMDVKPVIPEIDQKLIEELRSRNEDLEALLKAADKRADGEADLRREAEDLGETLHRQLREAHEKVASHKKASEQAQKSLETFVSENDQYRNVNNELRDLRDKNEALEKTLDEYRDFKEQLKDELETERGRTDGLARALHDARQQHRDQTELRDVLRTQLNHVQDRINNLMQDVRHDEAEWRKREHDLMTKNQLLQAALDHETNRRARMELEAEKLHKEHRESLAYRTKHENAQEEVSRLASVILGLQNENKQHQDSAHHSQRELKFLQERHDDIIISRSARLQDELDASKSSFENYRYDADARIARLQGQLDSAAVELQETKAKHDSNMHKMLENHNNAIVKAEQKHAAELDQRLAVHEDKLLDLRQQHNRDLNNAAEDMKALEYRHSEKLELRDDKIRHLEDKVKDLEERLEVSNQAARAAAAAAAKGINLPTPAASVVASPPHRASISSASMPFARGSDLPEKISPQALRETIMVLQDQLQNRESKLDKLEAELAAIDKDAPATVKERDTEITMLRELLDVRIDDLQELIATLEKPDYSRATVKDAAIRLKTQIKMEQQLKERAITGANLANNLPSTVATGLANLAQSPRAMVAAAAWGNWRKVRESGVGTAVSDFANNIGSQTPSRSSSTSSGLLTGMMTPPPSMRTPSNPRPLAAAASARKAGTTISPASTARPLRTASTQPRTLSSARPLRRGTNESRPGSSGSVMREPSSVEVEPPSTPLQLSVEESDFGEDVDEDASPLDGRQRDFEVEALEQLPNPAAMSSKLTSPRKSRSSSSKPVSPRALRAGAPAFTEEHVEVFEEN